MNNESNPTFLITHEERLAGERRRRAQSCGPDLLEALEELLTLVEDEGVNLRTNAYVNAQKAVAKVKGNP